MPTLSTAWEPSATSKAFAAGVAAAGVEVEAELAKFRAYDHREVLRDPDRAYVAWLKRAVGFNHAKKQPSQDEQQRKSALDAAIEEIKGFHQRCPSDFERLRAFMEGHTWWDKSSREWQINQMRMAVRDREMIYDHLDQQGIR